ncbi:sn-glycerol-1-phosphate dehydrogenase [Saccharococcus caldoxylosilyticus]|uniref:sn-glycerol-1-phosphate dehydrogenase n=1 Tax=Saccharococcus caldoxylosilyticus TaxID=81408 RepID=UPI001FCC818F|nr:sn-glycerol-1-phosphate dehydrogenase [Parageobacillus caldoxylosilyticus]BDG36086.1 glycerol-1-phosphate dehydrogenase [NAD(P)+] [Parageobacillus caldoxylosilyticus]BDG39870.1 glycerol-1-phosphate dehydrogenase [NAD(P)+] [Parageobacillus caldoxylosilyticus]
MNQTLKEIVSLAGQCRCGHRHHDIPIEQMVVNHQAFKQLVAYLRHKRYEKVAIVADDHTFAAAGRLLCDRMKSESIRYTVCLVQPDENGDVIADERSIVQVLLETPNDTDVMIAVGAGTIHDITRFSSYKMKIPFISVPTAPSVDGFTSMGAPLIVLGMKQTIQAQAPIALFADIDVLRRAPKSMIAAGVGDMVAKYTSLVDWQFAHRMVGEPYCPLVHRLTEQSLQACIDYIDDIAAGDEQGIHVLMDALLQSGIAMLLMGQSYPASGAEHHLSHYWEMEFLRRKKRQVLHGAKVGVSTSIVIEHYQRMLLPLLNELEERPESIDEATWERFKANAAFVRKLFESLPSSEQVRAMMEKVGGAVAPEQLGIDQQLVERSLRQAHRLRRNRFTMLRFLNEFVL